MKGIWTYSHLLPAIAEEHQLSLGEGNTPLVKSRAIGKSLGLDNLYFKLELTNPSGSYKDRFAASAVSHMLQRESLLCLATSSGNTGAALAAYSTLAQIPCLLAVVDGAPGGKLQQMRIYGANTFTVTGFGKDVSITEQVMQSLSAISHQYGTTVQISAYRYCPDGMAGVQTIAYELAEALPRQQMQVFVPAGGGGLALAIIKGFEIWASQTRRFMRPAICCVQPAGNDTIATPLAKGEDRPAAIPTSTTKISGLQVPNVIDGEAVIAGCRATGGTGYTVMDEAAYHWQYQLAKTEGIYCEPAGAVALAGIETAVKQGSVDTSNPVVCIVTGHGFKDETSSASMAADAPGSRLDTVAAIQEYIRKSIEKK